MRLQLRVGGASEPHDEDLELALRASALSGGLISPPQGLKLGVAYHPLSRRNPQSLQPLSQDAPQEHLQRHGGRAGSASHRHGHELQVLHHHQQEQQQTRQGDMGPSSRQGLHQQQVYASSEAHPDASTSRQHHPALKAGAQNRPMPALTSQTGNHSNSPTSTATAAAAAAAATKAATLANR